LYRQESTQNICSSSGGAQGKKKEEMKLSLLAKLVEKLVWVLLISFCKISFPIKHLMAYYAETGSSCPPPQTNRLTLRITSLKLFNFNIKSNFLDKQFEVQEVQPLYEPLL
jgi:hypothetical protein